MKLLSSLILVTLLFAAYPLHGQTVYAVVLGNQKYVVGSSTLHSGLYRSSDLGKSWEHLGPENLKGYSMDAVDSSHGRILYIAAGNGVHRSVDSGRSWKIVTDWRMTEVMDVVVDQQDPRWVYAATAWGFWRSSDSGKSWSNPGGVFQQRYISRLEESGSILFAEESDTLFSSVNKGSQWSKMTFPRLMPGTYDVVQPLVQSTYPLVLEYYADRNGVGEFVDTVPRYEPKSINTGLPPATAVHALAWLPSSGTLLAGTFGQGVYRREGETWTPSGLEGSQIWRLIVKEY
jgi:hypothetical protein